MPDSAQQPRILIITRNLPPLLGGMERLVQNLAIGMNDWATLTVIGPRGCAEHLPDNIEVIETSEKLGGFLLSAFFLAHRAARKNTYDLVLGGSGLVAPILWMLSACHRTTSAVLLHGLDLVVDNRIYQWLFLPGIRRVNLVIANSQNTRELALQRRVQSDRITVINPGTTLPPTPDSAALRAFREAHAIRHKHLVIFVGRMTRRKGLSAFIRQCLPSIVAANPDTALVVVGENPAQSLNRKGEEQAVLAAAESSGVRGHIKFLGHVDDTELTCCYALADVQILPLVDVPGDVEGFGMIAVEAAACGTPTVAFQLGGVPDAIGRDNGLLVAPGNYTAFADAVSSVIQSGEPARERCRSHAESFAWPQYNARVRSAIEPYL